MMVAPREAAAAWAALAAFVLYGSLSAFRSDGQRVAALSDVSLPDIAQNLLLYVPFGVFGVWTLRRDTLSQRELYIRVTVVAGVYSCIMEMLQLASTSRIASPLDVIANMAGAWTGAVSSEATERVLAIVAEKVRPTGLLSAPARYVLAVLIVAIVAAAWYPFDVTFDVSTLSERTRAVRLDPWLWPGAAELLAQAGRFLVLAAVITVCLPGLATGAAWIAWLAASLAAIVVDLGQLAIGSQPVGGAVLLSQVAGAGAGAIFASRLLSDRHRRFTA